MDVRQQRSRDRLYDAALRLAADRPVGALTVSGVAREAGVHRSTFYELVASPAELVERALVAELDDLRAALLDDDDTDLDAAVSGTTRNVLEHVRRHAAIYRRGLAEDSGAASLHPMLARHFRETSRLLIDRARLRIDVPVPGVAAERVEDMAVHFVAAATVGAIEAWLAGDDLAGDELEVDGFVAAYVRLVPSWWPGELTEG